MTIIGEICIDSAHGSVGDHGSVLEECSRDSQSSNQERAIKCDAVRQDNSNNSSMLIETNDTVEGTASRRAGATLSDCDNNSDSDGGSDQQAPKMLRFWHHNQLENHQWTQHRHVGFEEEDSGSNRVLFLVRKLTERRIHATTDGKGPLQTGSCSVKCTCELSSPQQAYFQRRRHQVCNYRAFCSVVGEFLWIWNQATYFAHNLHASVTIIPSICSHDTHTNNELFQTHKLSKFSTVISDTLTTNANHLEVESSTCGPTTCLSQKQSCKRVSRCATFQATQRSWWNQGIPLGQKVIEINCLLSQISSL